SDGARVSTIRKTRQARADSHSDCTTLVDIEETPESGRDVICQVGNQRERFRTSEGDTDRRDESPGIIVAVNRQDHKPQPIGVYSDRAENVVPDAVVKGDVDAHGWSPLLGLAPAYRSRPGPVNSDQGASLDLGPEADIEHLAVAAILAAGDPHVVLLVLGLREVHRRGVDHASLHPSDNTHPEAGELVDVVDDGGSHWSSFPL